jgi:hypothetical protein
MPKSLATARTLKPGAKVLLGLPAEKPSALLDGLRWLFAATPDVRAAWYAQSAAPGEPPHLLLGVEVASRWEAVADRIGAVVQELSRPGERVDFVRLEGWEGLGAGFRRAGRRFYRRRWLGLL